jgi:hypothetical protein
MVAHTCNVLGCNFGRWRQEDHKFKTKMGYRVKPCLKIKRNPRKFPPKLAARIGLVQ